MIEMKCEKCKLKNKRIRQLEQLLENMATSADGLLRLVQVEKEETKKAA